MIEPFFCTRLGAEILCGDCDKLILGSPDEMIDACIGCPHFTDAKDRLKNKLVDDHKKSLQPREPEPTPSMSETQSETEVTPTVATTSEIRHSRHACDDSSCAAKDDDDCTGCDMFVPRQSTRIVNPGSDALRVAPPAQPVLPPASPPTSQDPPSPSPTSTVPDVTIKSPLESMKQAAASFRTKSKVRHIQVDGAPVHSSPANEKGAIKSVWTIARVARMLGTSPTYLTHIAKGIYKGRVKEGSYGHRLLSLMKEHNFTLQDLAFRSPVLRSMEKTKEEIEIRPRASDAPNRTGHRSLHNSTLEELLMEIQGRLNCDIRIELQVREVARPQQVDLSLNVEKTDTEEE